MNLKLRSALLFGLIVTVLLSIAFIFIYFQSEKFRKDDFELRLKQRALTTYNLLIEEHQIDSLLLQVIDRNTLNKLHDEKIIILGKDNNTLYSSSGQRKINITEELFNKINKSKYLGFSDGEMEAVGIFKNNATIIASANDLYGKRKLSYLLKILVVCWIVCVLVTGVASYIYVKTIFKPLVLLSDKINEVTESNLKQRVVVNPVNYELATVASNFNKMLDRLEQSFAVQKNFMQHASHELRTPLSNLLLQTEIALEKEKDNNEIQKILLPIYDDQKYLVEMVNGILSLSKFEQADYSGEMQDFRVDELLFDVADELMEHHHDYKINIDFLALPSQEKELIFLGMPGLMKIVFANLIRNGCIYSTEKSVKISIICNSSKVVINFYNDGPLITEDERKKLFMPFFRGSNNALKRGHGFGLSISKRIVDVHKGELYYSVSHDQLNCFTLQLHQG